MDLLQHEGHDDGGETDESCPMIMTVSLSGFNRKMYFNFN